MKTSKQLIQDFTDAHGLSLVPDANDLAKRHPDAVADELERRIKAVQCNSSPTLEGMGDD